MILKITSVSKDYDKNVVIRGSIELGTVRMGEIVKVGYNLSDYKEAVVKRIKLNDNLFFIAKQGDLAEITLTDVDYDDIHCGMRIITESNEHKIIHDGYTEAVLDDILIDLRKIMYKNARYRQITEFNEGDIDIIHKLTEDDRSCQILAYAYQQYSGVENLVLFTDEYVLIKQGENSQRIFYSESLPIKIRQYGNTDIDFSLLESRIASIRGAYCEWERKYNHLKSEYSYTLNESKIDITFAKLVAILNFVSDNMNLGLSKEYDRKKYEDLKTLKEYKAKAFGSSKVTFDEYTGEILHKEHTAADNKYGENRASFHSHPEVDHISPLQNSHGKYSTSVAGQLLTDEQFREILNQDSNYAITARKINRQKGSKSNSTFTGANNLPGDTSRKMNELAKRSETNIKKSVNATALKNLGKGAGKAAAAAAVIDAPANIYRQVKSVKSGVKTKKQALIDGTKETAKTAAVAAAAYVVNEVVSAIVKAAIKQYI